VNLEMSLEEGQNRKEELRKVTHEAEEIFIIF